MTLEAVGLYLDYPKNRITDETLNLLMQLAKESGLRVRIDAMFRGEKINITENRAVLHGALRALKGDPSLSMAIPQDGSDESCPLKRASSNDHLRNGDSINHRDTETRRKQGKLPSPSLFCLSHNG